MDQKFRDKILICVDCKEEFVFTVSAQEYFAEKGYSEDPKRCKSCYMELKRTRRRSDRDFVPREPQGVEVAEGSFGYPGDDFGNGKSGVAPDLQ